MACASLSILQIVSAPIDAPVVRSTSKLCQISTTAFHASPGIVVEGKTVTGFANVEEDFECLLFEEPLGRRALGRARPRRRGRGPLRRAGGREALPERGARVRSRQAFFARTNGNRRP